LLPGCRWCASALEAGEGADATVVLTEWNEFRALDLRRMKTAMRGDVLVDLRNVFRPALVREAGFRYTDIGRPGAEGAPKR
jgi:UDPglucose 6-dehydrogenase